MERGGDSQATQRALASMEASARVGRQRQTMQRTEECHPVGAFHAMPAVGCVRCGGKGCEDDKSFVWDYNQGSRQEVARVPRSTTCK